MKKLHILTYIAIALLSLVIGASVNPLVGSLTGVALAAVPMEQTARTFQMNGPDLSAIVGEIDLYFRRYNKVIWTQILKGVDFEKYMKKIPGQQGEYISTNSSRTDIIQPFQKAWTPKGGVTLTPYKNQVYRMKMDYVLDNMENLFGTYLAELSDESKEPKDYPFVKWLMEKHIIPGMTEELFKISVKGNYVAPTPGTAGTSLGSANGIFTIVTDEIAAGNLVPLTVGTVTSTNIVDKVELYNDSIPDEYQDIPGEIFMSMSNVRAYRRADREAHGNDTDWKGMTTDLYGTNKTLVGLPQLNGSNRFLFTPRGNMLCMYDKLIMPSPTVQQDKRDVYLLSDFHRGYGFDTLENVFVSDQA